MIEKLMRFYSMHLYTKEQVHMFVTKCVITEEEYKLIVGE